jgi:23S rRNA (adenine-N6)-dimethyltransferase
VYSKQRGLRSQNFLVSRALVRRLIRGSSITSQDTVLEIGAGTGILTEELLHAAREVVACETDARLIATLCARFKGVSNLRLFQRDFLELQLPTVPYKVFANVPFAITGEVVRKLLQAAQPPVDCYLVVQKEAADKFTLRPGRNTMAAVLYYPWWAVEVTYRFRRTDFDPPPHVDCVLMRCQPRPVPLIALSKKAAYFDFVAYRFVHDSGARDIPASRWLSLFKRSNLSATRGAFTELQRQQSQLRKIHRTRKDRDWRRFKAT